MTKTIDPALALAVTLGREDRYAPSNRVAKDARAMADLAIRALKTGKRSAAWRKLKALAALYGSTVFAEGEKIYLRLAEGRFASRGGLRVQII